VTSQTVSHAARFHGSPRIPGDKSISHRTLVLGALARGRTEIAGLLEAGDVRSTARCLRALGIAIEREGESTFVDGGGGFSAPNGVLDCGNSGTTLRVLMGVLAGAGVEATLTGDASLRRRPMRRVAEPLGRMGARIELTDGDLAPVTVRAARLRGIDHALPVASAQVKTALLLAGLAAEGRTRLTGEIRSRDHTERLLPHFGAAITVTPDAIEVEGGQTLRAARLVVPGDPSTAAFWMAAACLVPGGRVEIENVSLNPTRTGFLEALRRMGAAISVAVTAEAPEPVGRVRVEHGPLRAVEIGAAEVPSLIDELPILAVLASRAEGTTVVTGAAELRVKESDRIEALAANLRALGGRVETRPDGFAVEGGARLRGARVDSFGDHRIAMAFGVAGLAAEGETTIDGAACVDISCPGFFATLRDLTR
jgi:3-phosphoshikimate 1-carboxyvinyltransferase